MKLSKFLFYISIIYVPVNLLGMEKINEHKRQGEDEIQEELKTARLEYLYQNMPDLNNLGDIGLEEINSSKNDSIVENSIEYNPHVNSENQQSETVSYKEIYINNQKLFVCDQFECVEKYFTGKSGLKRHKEVTHFITQKKQFFTCKGCGQVFPGKNLLINHINEVDHPNLKRFTCDVVPDCRKSFSSKSNLRSHKMRHQGGHMCDFPGCSKTCSTKPDLIQHKKVHIKEEILNVGYPFSNVDAVLNVEQKPLLSDNERPKDLIWVNFDNGDEHKHQASEALEQQFTLQDFTNFSNVDLSANLWGCDMYNSVNYNSSANLSENQQPKSNFKQAKPKDIILINFDNNNEHLFFPCDQSNCSQIFVTNEELNIHKEQVHNVVSGKQVFTCKGLNCGLVFESKSELAQHIKFSNHPELKPFICDICGISLTTKSNLKAHKERHEIAAFICKVRGCGKNFRTVDDLLNHEKVHIKT